MVQSAKTALTEPTGSSREHGRFQSILTLTRATARYRGRRFFVIATNFGLAHVAESLSETGQIQLERLENVTTALGVLTEKSEKAQESLRLTVEGRLDAIRQDNAVKLDEMRQTVDEKP